MTKTSTKTITAAWTDADACARPLDMPEILAAYQGDRIECPACGSKRLTDNGFRTLSTMAFCCIDCGEQFDADAIIER